jgi:hypothetical protein
MRRDDTASVSQLLTTIVTMAKVESSPSVIERPWSQWRMLVATCEYRSSEPYSVAICDCLDCRKHNGALIFAAATFPKRAVSVEGKYRNFGPARENWTVRRAA